MQIQRLFINEKRCLVDFDIHFQTEDGASTTILIGENGTGKSTMMESILEILMSFDSPSIEKQIGYDYIFEYEYAQKNISITKYWHDYKFVVDGEVFEGSYSTIRRWLSGCRLFPKRIIAFYSGANNKLAPAINKMNTVYRKRYRKTMDEFFRLMHDDTVTQLPPTPIRKYNFCDEHMVPIYLSAILGGPNSFEKRYLIDECHFENIAHVDMIINLDKVEQFFGNDRFEGNSPSNLYYLADYIDHRFTGILRRGWLYASKGNGYFEIDALRECGIDAVAILEFFEILHDLFGAKYETYVTFGNRVVNSEDMSEGQRQLIKVLGMLGICKSEDCLILMDEPDAHMNPKWKYGLKKIMDGCLDEATNAQAIVATHDPLVINGVPKEFIRIFTYNEAVRQNNGFHITRVIEPTEDTAGMGIDGLLQSQYYGLQTTYDEPTFDKFKKRQLLYIKLINNEITPEEKDELRRLTRELGALPKSYTTIDFLYDDFIKVYRNSPLYHKEYLSFDELDRRRDEIEEIINALYEAQV